MDMKPTPPQANQADSAPTENFSFNFEEIKISYDRPKPGKWIPILSL